ncbi:hypothetical protein [Paludibacterium denitrificans]|nr:hypothetical protein [Paludibacterium denitrificans]
MNEYAEDGLYHVKIAVAGGSASAKRADPACTMPKPGVYYGGGW